MKHRKANLEEALRDLPESDTYTIDLLKREVDGCKQFLEKLAKLLK